MRGRCDLVVQRPVVRDEGNGVGLGCFEKIVRVLRLDVERYVVEEPRGLVRRTLTEPGHEVVSIPVENLREINRLSFVIDTQVTTLRQELASFLLELVLEVVGGEGAPWELRAARGSAIQSEVDARLIEPLPNDVVLEVVETHCLTAQAHFLKVEKTCRSGQEECEPRLLHVQNCVDGIVAKHDGYRGGVVGIDPIGEAAGLCGKKFGIAVRAVALKQPEIGIEALLVAAQGGVVHVAVLVHVSCKDSVEPLVGERAGGERRRWGVSYRRNFGAGRRRRCQ